MNGVFDSVILRFCDEHHNITPSTYICRKDSKPERMKAMIFAAGLGTRLRPLTNDRPKALVELEGQTLLERCIRRLIEQGVEEFVVNIHHFGRQIIDFLESRDRFGVTIHISDERDQLLDTGGGLKRAVTWLRDAPFVVHNVDILTNLDLNTMYQFHLEHKALSTLAVRDRNTSRYLLFDPEKRLCGWHHATKDIYRFCRSTETYSSQAFSGIHIISPQIFELMPEADAFSIIDLYLDLGSQHRIMAYPHQQDLWMDVGKPLHLEGAKAIIEDI